MILVMLNPIKISASELTQDEIIKYQQEEEQRQLSNTLTGLAIAQKGKWYGQCVIGVRQFLRVGKNKISGRAKDFETQGTEPVIGAVIKLNMSKYGHVGVVISFTEEEITYYDTNGDWKGRAAIRTIDSEDKRILGYKIVN